MSARFSTKFNHPHLLAPLHFTSFRLISCPFFKIRFLQLPVYVHTYIHTYIHTYMHACMDTYIHAYIQDNVEFRIIEVMSNEGLKFPSLGSFTKFLQQKNSKIL